MEDEIVSTVYLDNGGPGDQQPAHGLSSKTSFLSSERMGRKRCGEASPDFLLRCDVASWAGLKN